jgi:diguanylate cyclase (GGDEF)-like protein
MQDISSHDFVVSKCQKLMDLISELNKGYDVTISIGISFLEGEKSYDALFKKADIALYDAKKKGRDQIQFYE